MVSFRTFAPITLGAAILSAVLLLLVVCQLLGIVWSALTGKGIFGGGLSQAIVFLSWPGLFKSTLLSLWTGLSSGIIALFISKHLVGLQFQPGLMGRTASILVSAVRPILAIPHIAFAIALTLLIWPGGWIARLLSPSITGWQHVPDWIIIGDPLGLSLILGLVLREIPFLVFSMLGVLSTIEAKNNMHASKALGFDPLQAWERILWPQLWPKLRLPLALVLAYSLSNVEMAVVLGPNTPSPLAVVVLQLFTDANPDKFSQVSWAGLYLLALTSSATIAGIATLNLWESMQKHSAWHGPWAKTKRYLNLVWAYLALSMGAIVGAVFLLGGIATLLFALSNRWYFPDSLPNFTLTSLSNLSGDLVHASFQSIILGITASILAIGLLVLILEYFAARGRKSIPLPWLFGLYIPLIVPQILLVIALYAGALAIGVHTSWLATILCHALFCFCFSALLLGPTWLRFDQTIINQAKALGLGPWPRLFHIKIPLMETQLSLTLALSVTVSLALYLPTLILSGGRIDTLLTEGVHFASNLRRPQMAIFSLAQTLLSLVIFCLIGFLKRQTINKTIDHA